LAGGLLALLAVLTPGVPACSGNQYAPPDSGPTAAIRVASSCLANPARFFARINRQRTETYGCNQTAQWLVAPGRVVLEVQVEEAQYRIEPLTVELDLQAGQCASFLLRQRQGYDLEFFGLGACD
jgi:hypothetical protein